MWIPPKYVQLNKLDQRRQAGRLWLESWHASVRAVEKEPGAQRDGASWGTE